MTGRNALLRLHKNLLARMERLEKKLAGELATLQDINSTDAIRDSADLAFEAGGDEMSSRLAELDDRELSQIQQALARWRQGRYGNCEGGSGNCQKMIPLVRLNALPYTPFCINCERAMETQLGGQGRQSKAKWGQISDGQGPMQDKRINLFEMELNMSNNRRG